MSNQNILVVENLFSEPIILNRNLISFKKNNSGLESNQEQEEACYSGRFKKLLIDK